MGQATKITSAAGSGGLAPAPNVTAPTKQSQLPQISFPVYPLGTTTSGVEHWQLGLWVHIPKTVGTLAALYFYIDGPQGAMPPEPTRLIGGPDFGPSGGFAAIADTDYLVESVDLGPNAQNNVTYLDLKVAASNGISETANPYTYGLPFVVPGFQIASPVAITSIVITYPFDANGNPLFNMAGTFTPPSDPTFSYLLIAGFPYTTLASTILATPATGSVTFSVNSFSAVPQQDFQNGDYIQIDNETFLITGGAALGSPTQTWTATRAQNSFTVAGNPPTVAAQHNPGAGILQLMGQRGVYIAESKPGQNSWATFLQFPYDEQRSIYLQCWSQTVSDQTSSPFPIGLGSSITGQTCLLVTPAAFPQLNLLPPAKKLNLGNANPQSVGAGIGLTSGGQLTSGTPNPSNLVTNPSFELTPVNWLLGGTTSITSAQAHTGTHCALITGTNAGGNIQQINIPVQAGQVYTLSVWLRLVTSNTDGNLSVVVDYYSGLYPTGYLASYGFGAPPYSSLIPSQLNSTGWTLFTAPIGTSPANAAYAVVRVTIGSTNNTTGGWYVDDVSLTRAPQVSNGITTDAYGNLIFNSGSTDFQFVNGQVVIAGVNLSKAYNFSTQFSLASGFLTVTSLLIGSGGVILTGAIQVGGTGQAMSIMKFFQPGNSILYGFIGADTGPGGSGYIGAWFNQMGIGGAPLAPLIFASGNSLAITGATISGTIGTKGLTIAGTTGFLVITSGFLTVNIDATNLVKVTSSQGKSYTQLGYGAVTATTTINPYNGNPGGPFSYSTISATGLDGASGALTLQNGGTGTPFNVQYVGQGSTTPGTPGAYTGYVFVYVNGTIHKLWFTN